MSAINPYETPQSDPGLGPAKRIGVLTLFLYSLLLPALWLSTGFIMMHIKPGLRLGLPGLILILIVATVGMSWLMARVHLRPFKPKERWILTVFCSVWALLLETSALLYALSDPEGSGLTFNANAAKITLATTAILDFLLVWLVFKLWSPKFVKWYLKRIKQSGYLEQKSTISEIKQRFDNDVERFTNLETGQAATVDAPLAMELITQAAVLTTKKIRRVLDIGCGAGNNTLKLLSYTSPFDCDLVDLSPAMLDKARERIAAINTGTIATFAEDFRSVHLPNASYDVILAAAVLHHLRDDADWETAFRKIYTLTAPGGSVWITDLIAHETSAVQALMWERYGKYLNSIKGEAYKDKVFAYIDKEDSPRPVTYQLELLRKVGFDRVELLHKNSCFAAFGAIKTS